VWAVRVLQTVFLVPQLIMLAAVAVQDTTRLAQPHLAVVMETLTVVVLALLELLIQVVVGAVVLLVLLAVQVS
jgi:hypothetical protein